MTVATMLMTERIARVLAAFEFSHNADGGLDSAGLQIKHRWQDYGDRAISILKAMREPDEAMAASGDPLVWNAMIAAALGESNTDDGTGDEGYTPPEPGTDPMHEGP